MTISLILRWLCEQAWPRNDRTRFQLLDPLTALRVVFRCVHGDQGATPRTHQRPNGVFQEVSISGGRNRNVFGRNRVSTDGQSLAAQIAELKSAKCEKVFQEKISGARSDRKHLSQLITALVKGDVLVVTRLDRLARSTRDLLNLLGTIAEKGAGFKSLRDAWADTTTAHGRLMLTVLGGLAVAKCRRVRRHHHGEVRGPGHQEDGRDRLEAAALPQQRQHLHWCRHWASWRGEGAGHHFGGLSDGRTRSAVEG
jgi:hypothetical protein